MRESRKFTQLDGWELLIRVRRRAEKFSREFARLSICRCAIKALQASTASSSSSSSPSVQPSRSRCIAGNSDAANRGAHLPQRCLASRRNRASYSLFFVKIMISLHTKRCTSFEDGGDVRLLIILGSSSLLDGVPWLRCAPIRPPICFDSAGSPASAVPPSRTHANLKTFSTCKMAYSSQVNSRC